MMMEKAISILLIIVGIIHLMPIAGVMGSAKLTALYGLNFEEPNLQILMRHRAVLFGILGVVIVFSAFRQSFQPLALVIGVSSTVSFALLAWKVGGYNQAIQRVVWADLAAIVCIALAAILLVITQWGRQ